VGALFLISYFGVFAGAAVLGPILEAPDYLEKFHPNKIQVVTGVLLELVNGIAVLGIAVLLYPFLKHYGEGIALGYVGLRVLECAMQVAMDMSPLSMLSLSRDFIQSGGTNASLFQILGTSYLADREAASVMLLVFFSTGALLFYHLLYKSKLVPRFISVWGVIALVLIVVMNILDVQGNAGLFFALPIIGNEIFLALWLIVKGFDPSAVASRPAIGSTILAS
jgi:hypothetical protein